MKTGMREATRKSYRLYIDTVIHRSKYYKKINHTDLAHELHVTVTLGSELKNLGVVERKTGLWSGYNGYDQDDLIEKVRDAVITKVRAKAARKKEESVKSIKGYQLQELVKNVDLSKLGKPTQIPLKFDASATDQMLERIAVALETIASGYEAYMKSRKK